MYHQCVFSGIKIHNLSDIVVHLFLIFTYMDDLSIPILKKEARITFGSVVIQELQTCISLLSETIDSKELTTKIEQKRFHDFTATERVFMQLMNIVKQAYKDAESNGMVHYNDLKDSISSSMSSPSSV